MGDHGTTYTYTASRVDLRVGAVRRDRLSVLEALEGARQPGRVYRALRIRVFPLRPPRDEALFTKITIRWVIQTSMTLQTKREQSETFEGVLPGSPGRNLASTVLFVPYSSLDRLMCAIFRVVCAIFIWP